MERVQESYKGHHIVIEEPAGGERGAVEEEAQEEPRVTIGEQPVNVIRNSDGTYSSEGDFYAKYTSLLELAQASIDAHLPER